MFRIQGLEEVTEMTEESDATDQMSIGSITSDSSMHSTDSELNERIAVQDLIPGYQKEVNEQFTSETDFVYDIEDYDTCKLNGQLKKCIQQMNCKLPIRQVKGQPSYLIGSRLYQLSLENNTVHVCEKKDDVVVGKSMPFTEMVQKLGETHLIMLMYYKDRSGLALDDIMARLLESEELPGIVPREHRLMWSHAQ